MGSQSQVRDELRRAVGERDEAAARLQRAVLEASISGLSQREIARELGVSQPAVSQMIANDRKKALLTRGPVGKKLAQHRAQVLDIAKAHGASKVRVFGSVARGEDDEDSDVDLLVVMPEKFGIFGLTGLSLELEDALGVPVDVIPEQIVKRDMLPALAATAVAL